LTVRVPLVFAAPAVEGFELVWPEHATNSGKASNQAIRCAAWCDIWVAPVGLKR